jgi:Flp pilus assembly pilin Flp
MLRAAQALRFDVDTPQTAAIEYGFIVTCVGLTMIAVFTEIGYWATTTVSDIELYLP